MERCQATFPCFANNGMLSAENKRAREAQRDSKKFQAVRSLVLLERTRLAHTHRVSPFDFLSEHHMDIAIRAVLAYHKEFKHLPQSSFVESKMVSNFFKTQTAGRLEMAQFLRCACDVQLGRLCVRVIARRTTSQSIQCTNPGVVEYNGHVYCRACYRYLATQATNAGLSLDMLVVGAQMARQPPANNVIRDFLTQVPCPTDEDWQRFRVDDLKAFIRSSYPALSAPPKGALAGRKSDLMARARGLALDPVHAGGRGHVHGHGRGRGDRRGCGRGGKGDKAGKGGRDGGHSGVGDRRGAHGHGNGGGRGGRGCGDEESANGGGSAAGGHGGLGVDVKAVCADAGFRLEYAPADGACFFHAVGRALSADAGTLRDEAVSAIAQVWDDFFPFLSPSVPQNRDAYVTFMSRPQEWAGELEMAALERSRGLRIRPWSVVNGQLEERLRPLAGNAVSHTIVNVFYTQTFDGEGREVGHYDALLDP